MSKAVSPSRPSIRVRVSRSSAPSRRSHPQVGWGAAVRRHAFPHRERERRGGAQRRRAEVGHELRLQVGLAGAGRIAIAPTRSTAAWKPQPAVQSP